MNNILLVEDDVDLNNAYSIILKQDQYKVKSAYNGQEALDILKSFKPDLILLDLIMPVKSGIEFLREYAEANDQPPKILIITNLENSNEITEALAIGGYKCVVKSHTTPQGLKKIVKSTINKKD